MPQASWREGLVHGPNADDFFKDYLERAMRFELTTPTLARLCSTPELRPHHRWLLLNSDAIYAPLSAV